MASLRIQMLGAMPSSFDEEEDGMRKLILAAIAATTSLVAISPAMAIQGCGPGGHRNYYGRCVPNYRPAYGPAYGYGGGPALVIGSYYPRRGYWDGRRYWWHRDRWHGGWRYR